MQIKNGLVYPLQADRTLLNRSLDITEPLRIGSSINNPACKQLMPTANIQIHIGNTCIRAILDSGSDVSYMTTTLVEILGLPLHPSSLNLTIGAVSAGFTTVNYTVASVGIRENRKIHTFLIFEGAKAEFQCVLGTDFLKTHSLGRIQLHSRLFSN